MSGLLLSIKNFLQNRHYSLGSVPEEAKLAESLGRNGENKKGGQEAAFLSQKRTSLLRRSSSRLRLRDTYHRRRFLDHQWHELQRCP